VRGLREFRSSYSLNMERVTAITDEKIISGEANGSEVFPHETKAINTRTEVGRADGITAAF
jgi:hypothetical protein